MADKKNTTPTTPASFYGTPPTVFPQYTSGAWANLPTGVLGAPPPAPPAPPPTGGPLPGQAIPGLQQNIRGLLGGLKGGKASLGSLSPDAMTTLTQGWGLFGGGAPMPTTLSPYKHAFDHYKWPQ